MSGPGVRSTREGANGLAKALAYFAAICWGFVILGATFMALGEPAAINPVIGAGVPAVACTVGAYLEHRSSRSSR
jgi:lipopolysaccharide export LptBFGC system permease protein LptF